MDPCVIRNLRWERNVLTGDIITSDGGAYFNIPIRSSVPLIDFIPEPKGNYEGLCKVIDDGSVFAMIVFPVINTQKDLRPGEARFRSFLGDEIVLGNRIIKFLSGPVEVDISGQEGLVKIKSKDIKAHTAQGDILFDDNEIRIDVIEDTKTRRKVAYLKLIKGRNPSIELDVENQSKVNLNKSRIEIKSGQAQIVVKHSKEIEIHNPSAKIKIFPNGDIEIGDSPPKIVLRKSSGEIEIHAGPSGIVFKTPTAKPGDKVLTSQTVFCPILGPLVAFGEGSLKLRSG